MRLSEKSKKGYLGESDEMGQVKCHNSCNLMKTKSLPSHLVQERLLPSALDLLLAVFALSSGSLMTTGDHRSEKKTTTAETEVEQSFEVPVLAEST
nr:hypothetical protein BgiMline_004347 [Biomphalaria glabrata]